MDKETKAEIQSPCPSMGEAVNKAAQHLPSGYQVIISVEHEGYGVKLRHPTGDEFEVDGGDGGIIGDVNEAICLANGFISY